MADSEVADIAKTLSILEVAKETSGILSALDKKTINQVSDLYFDCSDESMLGKTREALISGDSRLITEFASQVDNQMLQKASRCVNKETAKKLRQQKIKRKEAMEMADRIKAARIPPDRVKVALYSQQTVKIITIVANDINASIRSKLLIIGTGDTTKQLVVLPLNYEYTICYMQPPESTKRKIHPHSERLAGLKLSEFIIVRGNMLLPVDITQEDILALRK